MAVEPFDIEKVKAFFKDKWTKKVVCPVCESTDWSYYKDAIRCPIWGSESASYPMVVVGCDRCSYVMLFSAVRTGGLPPDPPKGGQANG